jgi:hypothetical protein
MNILVPSTPKQHVMTAGMLADFVMNPNTASSVIFPDIRLDVFQQVRLIIKWLVPNVMDDSGINSGKTLEDWMISNLGGCLIPDHWVGVFYPRFETGKRTFWKYYSNKMCMSPIFRAQMGSLDEPDITDREARKKGASCWICSFKAGGQVEMPVPDIEGKAAGQKSTRYNRLVLGEYVVWDAAGDTLDDEIIRRCTRPSWNPDHPVWCNKILFSAHAERRGHPSFRRHAQFVREIKAGNPNYAILANSYKDFTTLPGPGGRPFNETIRRNAEKAMKLASGSSVKSDSVRLSNDFGIWSLLANGFITGDMIDRAQESGRRLGLEPLLTARMWDELAKHRVK